MEKGEYRGGECDMKKGRKVGELYSFFFNDTATTEIYTLSLHDALPIWSDGGAG